jgi:hypothetical protein
MKSSPEPKKSIFSRLPSFAWIIIILVGGAAVIGGIIALFVGLSTVEGLASVILLVVFIAVLRLFSSLDTSAGGAWGGLIKAGGVLFFAAMGLAIDQPGNAIYNLPLQWIYCPANSTLTRDVSVSNPRVGTTSITQRFNCVGVEKNVVKRIGDGEIILVRFAEYIVIGYVAIGLNRLYNRLRRKSQPADSAKKTA